MAWTVCTLVYIRARRTVPSESTVTATGIRINAIIARCVGMAVIADTVINIRTTSTVAGKATLACTAVAARTVYAVGIDITRV